MARSKIELALSEKQLQEFCARLANTPNLTLKTLQREAQKLGITVSLMGAKTFRDGAFANHIEKMRRAKELALQLKEVDNADAAGSIADAGALVLMQQVYDTLTSGEEIDFDSFSKIISRLRIGDHRLRELNAKLKEYEAKEAEREAQKTKTLNALKNGGGLSAEALERIETAIGNL